jgi:type II secretory pathway component PulC
MFLFKQTIPLRKSFLPIATEYKMVGDKVAVDITKIYQNDLFNTIQQETSIQKVPVLPLLTMPVPPSPQATPLFSVAQAVFLPPLQVQLKGVLYSSHVADIRAIVANLKSGQEQLCAVDDMIDDAHIIRINHDNILVMRPNGQQETIFIELQEAAKSINALRNTAWDEAIKAVGAFSYFIDPYNFAKLVHDPATLLDQLNLTIALNAQGQRIGRCIGVIDFKSVGNALGFASGDIITHINGISVIGTKKCLAIFHSLKDLQEGAVIQVDFRRNDRPMKMTYALQSIDDRKKEEQPIKKIQENVLTVRPYDAFNTTNAIKKRDSAYMREHGGRQALLRRNV